MFAVTTRKTSNKRTDYLIILLGFFVIVMLSDVARAEKILQVGVYKYDLKLKRSLKKLAEHVKKKSKGQLMLNVLNMNHPLRLGHLKTSGKNIDITPIYSTSETFNILGINENFLLNGPYQIRLVLKEKANEFKKRYKVQYLTTWEMGTYAFVGKKPFKTPADFMDNKIASTSNFKSLGAKFINIKYQKRAKTFSQWKIDGFETKILDPKLPKLLASTKGVLTLTNHRFVSAIFFIKPTSFNSLDSNEQSILGDAFDKFRAKHNHEVVEMENQLLKSLQRRNKSNVVRANVPAFKSLLIPDILKRYERVAPSELKQLQNVAGSTGCSSLLKCKCQSDRYGDNYEGTCQKVCYDNNHCKDQY